MEDESSSDEAQSSQEEEEDNPVQVSQEQANVGEKRKRPKDDESGSGDDGEPVTKKQKTHPASNTDTPREVSLYPAFNAKMEFDEKTTPGSTFLCKKENLDQTIFTKVTEYNTVIILNVHQRMFYSSLMQLGNFYKKNVIVKNSFDEKPAYKWGSDFTTFNFEATTGDMHSASPMNTKSGVQFYQGMMNRFHRIFVDLASDLFGILHEKAEAIGFRETDSEADILQGLWKKLNSPFSMKVPGTEREYTKLKPELVIPDGDIRKSYLRFDFSQIQKINMGLNNRRWTEHKEPSQGTRQKFSEYLETAEDRRQKGLDTFNDEEMKSIRTVIETPSFDKFEFIEPVVFIPGPGNEDVPHSIVKLIRDGNRPPPNTNVYMKIGIKSVRLTTNGKGINVELDRRIHIPCGYADGTSSMRSELSDISGLPGAKQMVHGQFGGQSTSMSFGGHN